MPSRRRAERLPSPPARAQADELRRLDHRHAARVALGLLGPGLVLVLTGRDALMVYAVFGSFTGMYGRLQEPLTRLRHQFHGAGMLVTGVALGVALSHSRASPAVLVGCVTAFATVGSLITDRLRLRPGGPFFGLFALGATATVDPGLVSPWLAIAICAGTAVFAMTLTLGSGLVVGGRAAVAAGRWGREPGGLPAGALGQAVRYAAATGTAGSAGLLLGLDHANWAMAAAAVPLAVITTGEPLDLRAVVHRGLHRLGGTLAGLVVTALALLPAPSPVLLGATVMVLLFPTELFMSRHYGVALGFFTPLIMIMTQLAKPADPTGMLVARGLDTVIGVLAGVGAAAAIGGRVGEGWRRRHAPAA